jgi:hypothetical protein
MEPIEQMEQIGQIGDVGLMDRRTGKRGTGRAVIQGPRAKLARPIGLPTHQLPRVSLRPLRCFRFSADAMVSPCRKRAREDHDAAGCRNCCS